MSSYGIGNEILDSLKKVLLGSFGEHNQGKLVLDIIITWKEILDKFARTAVMKKHFKNYKKWCKYLDWKSSLW
ncbi:unnamed protein product [Lupinus luteus]|uniref:Uncharacterized protein n=1 Tax=Lupinus luteus TaxID=3873 RepID=A0AAV1VPP8_LUPLU